METLLNTLNFATVLLLVLIIALLFMVSRTDWMAETYDLRHFVKSLFKLKGVKK